MSSAPFQFLCSRLICFFPSVAGMLCARHASSASSAPLRLPWFFVRPSEPQRPCCEETSVRKNISEWHVSCTQSLLRLEYVAPSAKVDYSLSGSGQVCLRWHGQVVWLKEVRTAWEVRKGSRFVWCTYPTEGRHKCTIWQASFSFRWVLIRFIFVKENVNFENCIIFWQWTCIIVFDEHSNR